MRPRKPLPIKQVIRDALKEAMYAPTKRRYDAQLLEIITTNTTQQNLQHASFNYKGVLYSFENKPLQFNFQRLMPELHPSMDLLLAEAKKLETEEMPYVVGFFNRVVTASNSLADYYRLLPESVHPVLDRLGLTADLLPPELTYEQVEKFKADNQAWIKLLKKRMFLDLITS